MPIQFLHDGSDFRSYGGGSFAKDSRGSGGLFWWTIAIFLLLALATVSWFASIMVFKYPEKPLHYRLLTRMGKLEEIKKFTPSKMPRGQVVSPTRLLEDYGFFTSDRLRVTNDGWKRGYIRNFIDQGPVYVNGSFVVQAARQLTADDAFTSGWIVVARASELEDVRVELVFPGLALTDAPFHAGDVITVDNKKIYASTLHLQKRDGDCVTATLVPLLYDQVTMPDGSVAKLEVPKVLNMEAAWPIWRDVVIDEAASQPAVAKAVQVSAAKPAVR
jgi:hypothetical protein